MLLDRHIYRGRLNYLLFGRRIEKVKGWLHRITAPAVKAEPEAQPTEDIALHRSYQYDPPPVPAPAPEPTPPPESDNYNEDEEYMRHMANTDEGPQPGAVDADDLLVLLSVFSKGKSATQQEIATARRAMRAVSGSQIEQAILDQLNGKDGYVAVMLDMITKDLHAEDDTPPRENKKSDRAFRLEDFV